MHEAKEGLDTDVIPGNSGSIGVSRILPPQAREILKNASAVASQYSEDSVKRKRIIERAVEEVRHKWPQYFSNGRGRG